MIKGLIRFCVTHPSFVVVLTLALSAAGIMTFFTLPIDAVPDITNTQVQIITQVDGLVPEEIERKITFPVEAGLSGILGVKQTRSVTRFGISHITVVFEDHVDIYRARQLVAERLVTVRSELPPGVSPELGPITTGLGEIFHYQIEAKEVKRDARERVLQLMELRALQDWFVRPRLLRVQGVTEVNTIGGFEKQFHIQPDFERMAKYVVHFDEIAQAIQRNNLTVGGGYVERDRRQFLIQADGLVRSLDELKSIPVKLTKSLQTVKISDIATVTLAEELRNGAALVNGEEAVVGTVMMMLGENSRIVAQNVGSELQRISADLPAWAELRPLYDRSVMVDATLLTVKKNLVFGCLLVVVFLFLLVGNVHASLIVALVIPVSLLITFILMKLNGISGNLMSLGCLDFGVIIDSAVIVVDATMRLVITTREQLGRALGRSELREATIDATSHVFKEAFFGQLIIVIVFLPIFALTGVEGKMFTPIAATFVFALLAALGLSLTLVPALCGLLLPGDLATRRPWLMQQAEKVFAPVLERVLRQRRGVIAGALAVVAVSLFVFTQMGGEFIPQLDEGSIAFDVVRPSDIATSRSIAQQQRMDKVIASFPEVAHVFARFGAASVPADPVGINMGDSIVMLKDKHTWPAVKDGRPRTKAELTRDMAQAVRAAVPDQSFMLTQPMQMKFNDLLEGIKADVAIKVFGRDIRVLEEVSRQISEVVRKVAGAGEVQLQLKDRVPLLMVRPRPEVLRELGFGSASILESVSRAYQGERLGYLFQDVQRFPIVMRLPIEKRADEAYLRRLPVGFGEGLQVPLEDVASVKFEQTYHSIFRENGERRTAVLVSLKDRDVQSYVEEAMRKVQAEVKVPAGYRVDWGGNYKNLQNAKRSLAVLIPLTLAFIFFVIYSMFSSVTDAAVIFTCVPLSLVGGILLLWAAGLNFSVSAGVGFVALFGIAVLNGVILVSHYRELRAHGADAETAVRKGTLTLLRPILMTALVDVFGFLPMMLASGLGAEVQRPLATVVVGGILSATALALLVLPVLYLVVDRWRGAKAIP